MDASSVSQEAAVALARAECHIVLSVFWPQQAGTPANAGARACNILTHPRLRPRTDRRRDRRERCRRGVVW